MPSDPLLAEALARVEWKLDSIIRHLHTLSFVAGHGVPLIPSMGLAGVTCPACGQEVQHQMDLTAGAVRRVCGCSTGKLPPVIAIIVPVQQGAQHGSESRDSRSAEDRGAGGEPAEDRRKREGR